MTAEAFSVPKVDAGLVTGLDLDAEIAGHGVDLANDRVLGIP